MTNHVQGNNVWGTPYHPQAPHPGQPPTQRGPWTRPGWGIVPAVLGTGVALVGVVALNWAEGAPLLAVADAYASAMDKGIVQRQFGNHIMQWYLSVGALLLVLLHAAYMTAWAAGGVRGPKSAKVLLSLSGKSIAAGRLGPMRAMMAGVSAFLVVAHLIAILRLLDGDPGSLEIGGWTMLGGLVLITVGAAIGPRLPARPPNPMPSQGMQPPPGGFARPPR